MQPVPEEEGAKVSYKLKNERYGAKIVDAVKAMGCNNQNQFDALCSLAYNGGNGSITQSNSLTDTIRKNPNDESAIRPVWESFKITSNGVVLPGLIARRKQECNMYFGKEVEMRPIGLINTSGNVSGTVTDNNGDGWLPTGGSCSGGGDLNGYKSFSNEFGDDWLCPVKEATVTSVYGYRESPTGGGTKFHHGTDLGLPTGSHTVASKDGVVLQAGWENPNDHSQGYGLRVWIQHGDYKVVYPHLSAMSVSVGQNVKRGEQIGQIGSTGSSTGAHCHWEIRRLSDNESTNPAPVLKKGDVV